MVVQEEAHVRRTWMEVSVSGTSTRVLDTSLSVSYTSPSVPYTFPNVLDTLQAQAQEEQLRLGIP